MYSVVVQVKQFEFLGAGEGASRRQVVDEILGKVEPF